MAKDITVRVNGQNPDGSVNISMPDGANNPFMQAGGASSAMVPYTPSPLAQNVGYRARIGNVEVMFASEADFLKADKAWREQLQVNNVPSLGGSQGSGGTNWLRTGASVAEAAGAYMNGRAIRKRITDVDDALEDSRAAQATIANLQTKYPDLGPALADAFRAERDATIAMVRLLEDQLLAVDIQTGAGVARAVSEMWDGSSASSVMGMGNSGLLAGGVGLGLGLLLSRDDNNSNSRSRNRR
jgi:hypothetical protein